MKARRIEVHDAPADGRYGRVRYFAAGEQLGPAAFTDAALNVTELFV